jgi:hypothetical protein
MRYFLALLSFGLLGCNTGPMVAPPGSQLSDPPQVQVSWFGCPVDPQTGIQINPNCQYSPPLIMPISMRVTDEDELPVNNVRISFASGFNDIYLLPQEVVEAIEFPDTPNWQAVAAEGRVFAEFTGQFEGGYGATYYEGWTDRSGAARVWMFINSMPIDPANGQSAGGSIMVDIGVDQEVILIESAT